MIIICNLAETWRGTTRRSPRSNCVNYDNPVTIAIGNDTYDHDDDSDKDDQTSNGIHGSICSSAL